MAYNFHELSPYVLIGNPLTLTVIEIFAVPGALIGALLYPLGLDPWVWRYVGLGIDGIMWAARTAGGLPGATIHLPAFAPWAIVFLTLAVLCAVLWRTALFRAMALPLAAIGLCGAAAGPTFDIAVPATGDAVALRGPDGRLAVIGARPSAFSAEQWLRADADGRPGARALQRTGCDGIGCMAPVRWAGGRRRPRQARFRRGLPARGNCRYAAVRANRLRRQTCDRSGQAQANRRAHLI